MSCWRNPTFIMFLQIVLKLFLRDTVEDVQSCVHREDQINSDRDTTNPTPVKTQIYALQLETEELFVMFMSAQADPVWISTQPWFPLRRSQCLYPVSWDSSSLPHAVLQNKLRNEMEFSFFSDVIVFTHLTFTLNYFNTTKNKKIKIKTAFRVTQCILGNEGAISEM